MSVVSIRLNGRPVDRIFIDLSICYFIVNIFLVLAGGCFMVLVDVPPKGGMKLEIPTCWVVAESEIQRVSNF